MVVWRLRGSQRGGEVMALSDNQVFLLMLEEFRRFECEECNGTGKVKFCPSYPDKCKGCEEEPCKQCGIKDTGTSTDLLK